MGGGWSGALDCLQSRVKYIQVKPSDKTLVKFIEAVEKAKTSLKRLFVFFFFTSFKKIEAICFRYNQNQDYHIKCRPEKQTNMLHKPLTICSFSLRIYVSRLPCLYTITQNILPKLLKKAISCYKSYDLQIAYFKKI